MITVKMIQYWHDCQKQELRERFGNLKELEDWIFGQMRADYSSEYGRDLLSFPKCDTEREICAVSVRPDYRGYVYWIKLIEDDHLGIMFSDGTFTAGQKHCTKMVREWLAGCERRKKNPMFHFASDESGADCDYRKSNVHGSVDGFCTDGNIRDRGDDMIPGRLIRKAAKRIHEIGECDARDEYSRGYDAAISVALDILLEEAGCKIDDVLGCDDDRDD